MARERALRAAREVFDPDAGGVPRSEAKASVLPSGETSGSADSPAATSMRIDVSISTFFSGGAAPRGRTSHAAARPTSAPPSQGSVRRQSGAGELAATIVGAASSATPASASSITRRASATSCNRFFGFRSRQRRRRRRIAGGVAGGSAAKSISRVSTAASVSGTVSPRKAERPVNVS